MCNCDYCYVIDHHRASCGGKKHTSSTRKERITGEAEGSFIADMCNKIPFRFLVLLCGEMPKNISLCMKRIWA